MKRKITALFAILVLVMGTIGVSAAEDRVYIADDYESYEVGKDYKIGINMSDLYAGWEVDNNVMKVEKNPFDESFGNSMLIDRTALYSNWDLNTLFKTTEETVLLDMQIGIKKLKEITVFGYFDAKGGDERGEQRQLLWFSDYNGRYVMKVGADSIDTTKDLKKRTMSRLTLAFKMDEDKGAKVRVYLDGEAVCGYTPIGIKSNSFVRFCIDGWVCGTGNEVYIDNLAVVGLSGTVEEYFAKAFPKSTAVPSQTISEPTKGEEKEPEIKDEPKEEFKPEKDPNGNINVYLDGKKLEFDVNPVLMNDRTLVPMRKIFEAIGADIEWNDETQTVVGKKENRIVKIKIGSEKATIGSEIVTLDQPAVLVNDRTMVPVRVVSEGLGLDVNWDNETESVIIKSK